MVARRPPRPPPPSRLAGAWRVQGPLLVGKHAHAASELILVCDGSIAVRVGDSELTATAAEVLILPAGVPHDQRHPGAWNCICVLAQGPAGDRPGARVVSLGADAHVARWFNELLALASLAEPVAADALLAALLRRLARLEQRAIDPSLPPLERACNFLVEHLSEVLSDEQVAAAAGISVSHLGAAFRSAHGCGPLRYLNRLRMDQAAELLRNPYADLGTVAAACGYADVGYFIRCFRRHHGVTPGTWRSGQVAVRHQRFILPQKKARSSERAVKKLMREDIQ